MAPGIEVLIRLKRSAKTKNIAVVIVTGSSDPHLRQVAEAVGMADFLQKPVDLDQLERTLSELGGLHHSSICRNQDRRRF